MRWLALVLIGLLCAAQGELWSAYGGIPNVLTLKQQIALQTQENAELRERNQALDAEVQDLKQGLQAIEERARSDVGMIAAGETFYQIIDSPAPSETTVGSERLTADSGK
ncbi:MAG: cell division protein FtsB [Gammaproteobacteria bacterium]